MTGAAKSPVSGSRRAPYTESPAGSSRSRLLPVEVELELFSGRPNPSLELSEDEARHLARRLEQLPRSSSSAPSELPGLGYRGVQLRGGVTLNHPQADPVAPVRVYGGLARQGAVVLLDPGRNLERWLLEVLRQRVGTRLRSVVEETLRAI